MKVRHVDATPYITKDGSIIRELLHPDNHGPGMQSLAEARVAPGATTLLHLHHSSEELYHITRGSGIMILDKQRFPIVTGDTIRIPPGTPHAVENTATQELVILCCCSPPYSHDDTLLIPSAAPVT